MALELQLLFLHMLGVEIHSNSICTLLSLKLFKALHDGFVGLGQVIKDPLGLELNFLSSVIHVPYSIVQFQIQHL